MRLKFNLVFWFFIGIISLKSYAQQAEISKLEEGFKTPPSSAKARTWWHWMNGNVSRSGITKDLEAMKAVGIQEAQLFNVKLSLPKGPVDYLSSEWLSLVRFAAQEAKRLGMEVSFHNSAGWSSSGGPWVTPDLAMQKVVYSELFFQGGMTINKKLPQPETKLGYYRDIAIFAFPKPIDTLKIADLDFKSLSGKVRNHLYPSSKEIPETAIVKKESIIDLTHNVSTEGILEWNAPKGEWVILRIGHTPTAKTNHPAPESGSGLECDKMSTKAVDLYWQKGVKPLLDVLDGLVGTVVKNCVIDSYEVGTANWTQGFDNQFKDLRGYDPTFYLPSLAGYYVESGDITERFLWDYRRTVGDLMAKNYYGHFRKLCHKNGLKLSVEPYWGPFDNMQVGAQGDIVMCEFWSGGHPFFDSPKFVSSIAHINGNPIVGAESFTGIGGWDDHPADLKSIGDSAWAEGINRFIFHTYVHQPWDIGPGLALSYHGTDFNRLNTWWRQSTGYMEYIARSQYLLQQGKNVADFLVFTGEASPNNAFLIPEIKAAGYDYDLIGHNNLMNLQVENKKLRTKASSFYRVLVVPKNQWMRPETLNKLKELANAGATILGSPPKQSPSLASYPKADKQVRQMAEELWSSGKITPLSISAYLDIAALPPDVGFEKTNSNSIRFIHRKVEDTDIYFLANTKKERYTNHVRFRVEGKQPELWNPMNGKIIKPAFWKNHSDGTTTLPISLEAEESIFVVFKPNTSNSSHLVKVETKLEEPNPVPLPNLKIIKAEYGTFLQEGIADITDLVAAEVKNNKLNFRVTRKFCDCDPAMGYKKTFRMRYQVGDRILETRAKELEYVTIASDKPIRIIRALFGKFKPETNGVPQRYAIADVTQTIKEKVDQGQFKILVQDKLAKPSPKNYGPSPSLRIRFSVNGIPTSRIIKKDNLLNLFQEHPKANILYDKEALTWVSPFPGKIVYEKSNGIIEEKKLDHVPDPIALNKDWSVNFPSKKETLFMKDLYSWSSSADEEIKYFSGTALYSKTFTLPDNALASDLSFDLELGDVQVMAEVIVNDISFGVLWKAPYTVKIDPALKQGTNTLKLKVTNLWVNRLIGDEQLAQDAVYVEDRLKQFPQWLEKPHQRPTSRVSFYSWKHWNKNDPLRPSGLLGPIKIRIYKKIQL